MNSLILVAALMGAPCEGQCRQPVRNLVAAVVDRKPVRSFASRVLERRPVRTLLRERPLLKRVRGRLFGRCR